jgi:predicted alpha/beta hydrolase
MPRSLGAQVLGFLGFVVLAGTSAMIYSAFGQREGFRFWGLCMVLISMVFTFMKRIPVSVGTKSLRPLEGWRKAYVLVPC